MLNLIQYLINIWIHSSTQGSSASICPQSMCHKARGGGGKFALFLLLCYHNGLLFGKRLDTFFSMSSDSKISRFTHPHIIGFVVDSLPNLLDVCGGKPYPERKSCGLKNIWIRVDRALDIFGKHISLRIICRP